MGVTSGGMEPLSLLSSAVTAVTPMRVQSGTQFGNPMGSVRQADVFRLHVEIEAVVAAIPADSARLDPSEGRGQMAVVLRVHPHHPRLDAMCHTKCTATIAGPDVGRQPILGIVCN